MSGNVLVIDDEPEILLVIDHFLTLKGFHVQTADNGPKGIEMFQSEAYDVLITDIRMPEMNGLEVMSRIRKLDENVEFIILTGYPSTEIAVRAMKDHGAFDFLTKPIKSMHDLLLTVNKAMERRRLRLEKKYLLEQLRQANKALKASEERMRALLDAATDTIVLVDTDGIILTINETGAQRLGQPKDQVIGKRVYDFFPHSVAENRKKAGQQAMDSKRPVCLEDERDGVRFQSIIYPVMDKNGHVVQLAVYAKDITQNVKAQKELEKKQAQLEIQTESLMESNIALKVLLKQRNQDKKELEDKVLFNVKQLVMPHVEKLKHSPLTTNQKVLVDVIASNLNEIVAPFYSDLAPGLRNLTPQEIQIANLIKQGKTTKEIAELLNLSPRTIETHRNNIRHKVGLKNTKTNLRTFLLSSN